MGALRESDVRRDRRHKLGTRWRRLAGDEVDVVGGIFGSDVGVVGYREREARFTDSTGPKDRNARRALLKDVDGGAQLRVAAVEDLRTRWHQRERQRTGKNQNRSSHEEPQVTLLDDGPALLAR